MNAVLLASFFLAFSAALKAEQVPDLGRQDRWTDSDKKSFLRYLKSNQSLPVLGQVKEVDQPAPYRVRKAAYLTLNAASDTVFVFSGTQDRLKTESTSIGPKLILGGHLFSWIRYYAGAQYNKFEQQKLDGTKARLVHYQVPVGLELALIPLGTPHTRYVVLRGGAAAHWIDGEAVKSDFEVPLMGFQRTWNLGLGYEWQISDSRWRLHAVAEGYRSWGNSSSSKFYGLGLSAGFVYTI